MKTLKSKKNIERKKFKELRREAISNSKVSILRQVQTSLSKLISKDINEGYIGIYWPLNGEVDLRPLKKSPELSLALPASNADGQLTYHKWGIGGLSNDCKGIPYPSTETPLNPNQMNLLLVPALAIDQEGIRLGYGGGFFDRLRSLPKWRAIPAFAILPKVCVSTKPLPKESWDIPFDGWINEEGLSLINKPKLS